MVFVSALACLVLMIQPPIAQDPSYHNFADTNTLFGIVHFWNVVSNLPFLLVGLLGLYKLHVSKTLQVIPDLRFSYSLFFFGVALVSFGSCYYHVAPTNGTLVWDRLPMTIAFMALISVIVGEQLSEYWAKRSVIPLLLIGFLSVIYWHITEQQGMGDLRLYALVQFLPMLLIPILLLCFQSKYSSCRGYWYLLLGYLAAKILEHFDDEVFALLGVMSGHPLKHVAAAIGIYFLIIGYERRAVR